MSLSTVASLSLTWMRSRRHQVDGRPDARQRVSTGKIMTRGVTGKAASTHVEQRIRNQLSPLVRERPTVQSFPIAPGKSTTYRVAPKSSPTKPPLKLIVSRISLAIRSGDEHFFITMNLPGVWFRRIARIGECDGRMLETVRAGAARQSSAVRLA